MAVDAGPERSVTLHSSWFGIVTAILGVVALALFAAAATVANGLTIVTALIVLAAVGAMLVVLFDMPIATRFEPEAIERLTLLRRRQIELDQIDRFGRTRRAIRRPGGGVASTGLVAWRNKRQVLLVDRLEGHTEHEELRTVLGKDETERLLGDVLAPPLNRTPTWVSRRKRWHPPTS